MNNLFLINNEEKDRILNLHETATKKHYLSEQPTLDMGQPIQPSTGPQTFEDSGAIIKKGLEGDPYIYGKLGNDYYYAKSSDNPNWVIANRSNSINAIKGKIYNEKIPVIKTVSPPIKSTAKKQPTKTIKPTIVPNKGTVAGSDKFKLKPELNPVAIDSTRVGNGRKQRIPDIRTTLKKLGPAKKSSLPLHLRACWDYIMGRTEPFTSADLTVEEQKFLKNVAILNSKKGLTYPVWKSIGAGNLPTAMSTGSKNEKEKSGSLLKPGLAGEFMYTLGEVDSPAIKVSPDKTKVTVSDNYDMNNKGKAKDEILKSFAKQIGSSLTGDATGYSVLRHFVGLKELAGYTGFPVNITV